MFSVSSLSAAADAIAQESARYFIWCFPCSPRLPDIPVRAGSREIHPALASRFFLMTDIRKMRKLFFNWDLIAWAGVGFQKLSYDYLIYRITKWSPIPQCCICDMKLRRGWQYRPLKFVSETRAKSKPNQWNHYCIKFEFYCGFCEDYRKKTSHEEDQAKKYFPGEPLWNFPQKVGKQVKLMFFAGARGFTDFQMADEV